MVSTREAPARSANAVVDRAGQSAESADPAAGSPPEQPFCSPLAPLTRLATVRRGTVVAVLADGEPIRLRRPGQLVIPRGNPLAPPLQVLAIATAPVELMVTVPDVATSDGTAIVAIDVQLSVRLSGPLPDAPEQSAIPALIRDHGADLGAELMRHVLARVDAAVRGAVTSNSAEDLRQRSLATVLADRWLPASFADGRLTRLGFHVPRVDWPHDTLDTSVDWPRVP